MADNITDVMILIMIILQV